MYIFSFSSSFTFLLNRSYAFQCSSTPCAIHSAAPNIFQLSRAQSFFSFPTCNFLFLSLALIFQPSQMDVPPMKTFSSSLVSIISSTSLTHRCVRREEEYSFVKPAQVKGGGGAELEGRRWWCWWRAAGTDPFSKLYLFICFLIAIWEEEKKERRNKKKGKACSRSHSRTEKRPRWPSLIKGIWPVYPPC